MANATLTYLKKRFRSDVDDIDIDPTDQSGLLWSDDDVLEYIDAAHSEFVAKAFYRRGILRLSIPADEEKVVFSDNVLDLRSTKGFLETARATVVEINATDIISQRDDYGVTIETDPYSSLPAGTPRAFSVDLEAGYVKLFPASSIDDTMEIPVFLEADEIADWDTEPNVQNRRHLRIIISGMKHFAYLKHDADVFNKDEADYWFAAFQSGISEVYGETDRRSSRPVTMKYGGI